MRHDAIVEAKKIRDEREAKQVKATGPAVAKRKRSKSREVKEALDEIAAVGLCAHCPVLQFRKLAAI